MKSLMLAALASLAIPAFADVSPEECDGLVADGLRANCYSELLRQEDQRLNLNYSEIKRVASKQLFSQVQIAQRTWIAFRDQDCAARKTMMSIVGVDGSVSETYCKAMKTYQRASDLAEIADFLNEETEGNEAE